MQNQIAKGSLSAKGLKAFPAVVALALSLWAGGAMCEDPVDNLSEIFWPDHPPKFVVHWDEGEEYAGDLGKNRTDWRTAPSYMAVCGQGTIQSLEQLISRDNGQRYLAVAISEMPVMESSIWDHHYADRMREFYIDPASAGDVARIIIEDTNDDAFDETVRMLRNAFALNAPVRITAKPVSRTHPGFDQVVLDTPFCVGEADMFKVRVCGEQGPCK